MMRRLSDSKRLSVEEAAAYCGVSASFLNKARVLGNGPSTADVLPERRARISSDKKGVRYRRHQAGRGD